MMSKLDVKVTKRKRNPILSDQSRMVVYRVYNFFRDQKFKGPLEINAVKEVTAEATGISQRTIDRIIREGDQSMEKNGFVDFPKIAKATRKREKSLIFEDLCVCAIRRKVHELYTVHNTMPVISVLTNYLLEDNIIDVSMKHQRNISRAVKATGFHYVKEEGYHKHILTESPVLIMSRKNYISRIQTYRKENRSIVYLDETYLHENRKITDCWQYEEECGLLQPVRQHKRLLIAHGGNTIGLLPKNLISFNQGDDKPVKFVNWLHDVFIPSLPENSIIVMNNVLYHCLQEKTEKKDETKSQVIQSLTLEDLVCNAGHHTLILPPYHGDLNPIKYIFRDIKEQVTNELFSAEMTRKIAYCEKLFAEFRGTHWANACNQVLKLEDEYMERDKIMEPSIRKSIASCKTKCAKFMEQFNHKNDESDESAESSEENSD